MSLFVVIEKGWDLSIQIVRARDAEHARSFCNRADEIIELIADGEPGPIWDHTDVGPDSR